MSLLDTPLEVLYMILEHGHILDHRNLSETYIYFKLRVNEYYHYKLKIKRDYDDTISYVTRYFESMDMQFSMFLYDEYNYTSAIYANILNKEDILFTINHKIFKIINKILLDYNSSPAPHNYGRYKKYVSLKLDIEIDYNDELIEMISGLNIDKIEPGIYYVGDALDKQIKLKIREYIMYMVSDTTIPDNGMEHFTYSELYNVRIELLKLDRDKFRF